MVCARGARLRANTVSDGDDDAATVLAPRWKDARERAESCCLVHCCSTLRAARRERTTLLMLLLRHVSMWLPDKYMHSANFTMCDARYMYMPSTIGIESNVNVVSRLRCCPALLTRSNESSCLIFSCLFKNCSWIRWNQFHIFRKIKFIKLLPEQFNFY